MQKVVQLLRLMRFIKRIPPRLACMLLTLTSFISLTAYSQDFQNGKVNLELKSVSLKEAFAEIQKQSGVRFIYDEDIKKYDTLKITQIVNDITVKTAVELILKGTNLQYVPEGNHVMISEKTAPKQTASPNAAAGQGQGTGGLKGRIVEFETSQPLPGASVFIVELNKGTTANSEGYYHFNNIKAGSYTLRVSFVSYTTENEVIQVKANREEVYDIKLQGNNQLGEVVVTAIGKTRRPVAHTTERQVLEEVKSASLVVSAISSEQISKSADRNAAEVMQRVAGVTTVDDKFVVIRGLNQRYNLTYLNDNVAPSTEAYSRAFALDLIPSRIIDKILVYKSPSPENQGDATGGVVKIYTKDAKMVKHFDIEVQGGWRTGTTFNKNFLTHQGGKWDFLGFDDGLRKLPNSIPSYGNLEKANLSQSEYVKTFSPYLNYGKKTALPNMQLIANYYNSFKVLGKQLSTLSSLSYKNERQHAEIYRQQGYGNNVHVNDQVNKDNRNTETGQLSLLQNFTYRLRDSSNIQFKNFLFQQGTLSTIVRQSHENMDFYTNQDKDNMLSYTQRFLYAGNFGGKHYFEKGKHKLQWNGGYTYNQLETPDQRIIRLTGSSQNYIGDYELQWRARGRNPSSGQSNDDRPITLGIISRLWSRMNEGVYNFTADYAYKANPSLSFKAGAFQQWKERKLNRRVYTINEGDVKGTYSDYSTGVGGYGQYVDPNIARFKEQELSFLWSTNYLREDGSGLKVVDRTSGSDTYLGTEQNNSGYVSFSFTPLSRKFEIYGGLRYEYNRQKIGGAIPPSTASSPRAINVPILVNNPTSNWLPSLNISWRPTDSWVVRTAYGKTLNRFEFREASPYNDLDLENNQIVMGNPNLKTAKAGNYDFRVEYYPANNKGETISAGIFYKELTNPIERIIFSQRQQNYFPFITFQNAGSATIKGVEIELRKNLSFLPGSFFKNFSVIANASFIRSEAVRDTNDVRSQGLATSNFYLNTFKRSLQGQAPYIVNAGLYYDNASLGAKVSLNYNLVGARIYAAGRDFTENTLLGGGYESAIYRSSIIELPRHQLDFSFTQRIISALQAKFSIQNLLDQDVKMAEDTNFSDKYEKLKEVGINAYGYKAYEGDIIYSRFKQGRHFLLTLSYSF